MKQLIIIEMDIEADTRVPDFDQLGERVQRMTGSKSVKVSTIITSPEICNLCARFVLP